MVYVVKVIKKITSVLPDMELITPCDTVCYVFNYKLFMAYVYIYIYIYIYILFLCLYIRSTFRTLVHVMFLPRFRNSTMFCTCLLEIGAPPLAHNTYHNNALSVSTIIIYRLKNKTRFIEIPYFVDRYILHVFISC